MVAPEMGPKPAQGWGSRTLAVVPARPFGPGLRLRAALQAVRRARFFRINRRKPMKVLLTHHYFPPDFAGGGEYVVLETARGLLQRGVDVRVLTTGDPRITEYEGIPTVRLPI